MAGAEADLAVRIDFAEEPRRRTRSVDQSVEVAGSIKEPDSEGEPPGRRVVALSLAFVGRGGSCPAAGIALGQSGRP